MALLLTADMAVTYGDNTCAGTVKTDTQAENYYCNGFHAGGVETVQSGDRTITESAPK